MRLLRLLSVLFTAALLVSVSNTAMAQTTATVGTGTSSSYFYGPIYRSSASSSFDWSQYHYLYSAADLSAAGILPGSTITSLAFQKNSTFVLTGTGDAFLDLYLKNSPTTALPASESWTNLTTGSTLVAAYTLNAANNLPATTGWWTLTFTTPFVYTGGTLELSVNWNCGTITGNPSDGAFNWLYGTYAAGTSLGNTAGTPITTNLADASYGGTERPNTQFTYTLPVLTCPPISGLSATPTATDVTLAWTAGGTETAWNIEYGPAGFTQGTGTVITSSSTTAVISNLNPATNYQAYVQADCGGGDVSFWIGTTFITSCATFTAPYTESFNLNTTPTCWTQSAGSGGPWAFSTASGVNTACGTPSDHTGNGGYFTWMDHSGTDAAVVLEMNDIDISALTTPYLEFYYSMCGAGYTPINLLHVEAWDGTAWNIVGTIQQATAGWEVFGYDLSTHVYNTNLVRLRFRAESGGASSDFNGDNLLDDISVIEAPTCIAPTNLAISNLTTSSVTLGWTAGATQTAWDIEWGVTGFTQGTGTLLTGVTTNPYALSGLSANTSYTFYVRADCGAVDGLSAWAGPFSFFTGYCSVSSTSAASYFDAFTTTGGATNISNTASGYATGGYQDATAMVVSQYATGSVNFTTTLVGTTVGVAIWVDWNNDLLFDISERVYNTNAYVATASGTITVPAGTPLGSYRMRAVMDYNATNPSACSPGTRSETEDYTFTVIALPSCVPPTTLTATSITTTGATLGWTAVGTETAWDIEWGAAGFTQGTGTVVTAVATNPYALSGLSANTSYSYYVRANCGGTTSAWTGPFAFTTPCSPYTVPYFEGFEAGYTDATAVAGCLSQQSVTGTSVWTANNTQTTYNRAPRTGGWNAFLQWSNDDWLFIPIDLIGGTSYTFECYARQDFATAIDADITVSYGTANNAAAMTNAIVATTGIVNGAYQQITGAFTPTATGTYYVGIKGYMSSSPYYISLDDISVITTPSCPIPNALAASNVTATSANLAWAGTSAAYEVQYGVAGFALGTGTTVASTTTTATAVGLSFETNYQFYVRAICAVGDTSPWSGAGSFFTGYCTPAPTSVDGQGITNVTIGTINNTTVAEAGNYGNYGSLVTDVQQGATVNAAITFNTLIYDYNTKIWVDWNNDLDFDDAGEEVYSGLSGITSPNTLNASFTVPANAALGNYRLRIGGIDSGTLTPCYTGSYGTYEDYTINVILPIPTLTPFALLTPANNATVVVAGPAQTTIQATWEATTIPGVVYEWRAALLNGSLNNPLLAIPADNMGMDTTITFNVQILDDVLAGFGVPIGGSVPLQWTAVAFANGDSLFATAPFNITLFRGGVATPLIVNAPQNNGSTTTLRAPNGSTSHTYMRAATVVLPTEFANAGIAANAAIRNFGFSVNGTIPAGAVTGVFKLYLQNTTDVTYGKGTAWSGITPGMTEVFNDTITINGGGSSWGVVLDTLFNYAGNSVYVAYDWELIANPLGTAISYLATTSLASSLVSQNSTTAPPATLGGSGFRPEFAWGIDRPADDLEITNLYALGKNTIDYNAGEEIFVLVTNNGYLPANKTISLNITGANTFATTETVSLLSGESTTVTFAPFSATATGFNNISVSVPADDVTSNNTKSWVQEITTNTLGYADTTLSGLGGVGYNTGSGLLLNRYFVDGPASVQAANIRIADNAATAGNTVYAVVIDTSGAIVAQSANVVLTAADLNTWKTFTFPTPANFDTEDFFIGLAQTANATGYFPLAFQIESPNRNAYFTAAIDGTGFGASSGGRRFMIEAVVGVVCNVTASATATDVTCNGLLDGTITTTVTGATAPITYAWDNGATTADLTGVGAGNYSVTVTDAEGCSATATATVAQPAVLAATTSAIADTSNAGIGQASVVAAGGTAPYTYSWSNGGTTAAITGLVTGNYTVTVTDANGCETTSTILVDNVVSTREAANYINDLAISPNPTRGLVSIRLELTKIADVNIKLYSINGQLVRDLGNYNTIGEVIELDLNNEPQGVYFVRFIIEGNVVTRKIVLTK